MQITVTPNPTDAKRLIIRNVRIAYADGLNVARVAKSKTPNPNAKPQFSSVFFIPKSDAAAIQAIQMAMWSAVQTKFGQQAEAKWRLINANNKLPFRDGDLKFNDQGQPMDGYAGNMFISGNAKADRPPILLDLYETAPGSGVPLKLERPQNRIYSGCYVNIEISMWAYDNNSDGVGADLLLVQFAGDGDRFGGGGEANVSAFGAVAAPQVAVGFGGAPMPAAPQFAAPQFAAPAAPQFAAPAAPQFAAPAAPQMPAAPQFAVPGSTAPL